MAAGFAVGIANEILDSITARDSWTPPAACWLQLHVGDPGSAGTSNVATNNTRKQLTFGSAAASGSIANTAAITWTAVPATEDYTFGTIWSASTSGTFLGSGTITANPVTSGEDFTVAIGSIVLTIPVAS